MPQNKRRRIDLVSSPEFVAGLESASIDDLRRRRKVCADLDVELSYYRRLIHGRMDLLGFELRRRRGEEQRSLLEALPEILAAGASNSPGFPERQVEVAVPSIPERGKRAVDRALSDDFLMRLPEVGDEELEEIQVRLGEIEAEVSRQRRTVFDAYDRIQAELTRRYRDGLLTVDDLLGQP